MNAYEWLVLKSAVERIDRARAADDALAVRSRNLTDLEQLVRKLLKVPAGALAGAPAAGLPVSPILARGARGGAQ